MLAAGLRRQVKDSGITMLAGQKSIYRAYTGGRHGRWAFEETVHLVSETSARPKTTGGRMPHKTLEKKNNSVEKNTEGVPKAVREIRATEFWKPTAAVKVGLIRRTRKAPRNFTKQNSTGTPPDADPAKSGAWSLGPFSYFLSICGLSVLSEGPNCALGRSINLRWQ